MQLSTLETFADALKAKFALPGGASPEDQSKSVVDDLFKAAGAAYGLTIEARIAGTGAQGPRLSAGLVRPE